MMRLNSSSSIYSYSNENHSNSARTSLVMDLHENQLQYVAYDGEFKVPTDIDQTFIRCNLAYQFYVVHVASFMGAIGFVFNILCCIVFAQKSIHKNIKGHMFKYLLFKSIFDALSLFFRLLIPVFMCESCFYTAYYITQLFYLVIEFYLGFVCLLCSMFCELAAHVDRYLIITQKYDRVVSLYRCKIMISRSNLSYKLIILGMLVYSMTFYSFKFFQTEIARAQYVKADQNASSRIVFIISENSSNASSTLSLEPDGMHFYYLKDTKFAFSQISIYLGFIHSLVRDFICVVLLFILNILIMISMKRFMHRKRSINNHNNSKNHSFSYNLQNNRSSYYKTNSLVRFDNNSNTANNIDSTNAAASVTTELVEKADRSPQQALKTQDFLSPQISVSPSKSSASSARQGVSSPGDTPVKTLRHSILKLANTNSSSNNAGRSSKHSRAEKAEYKITLMVIVTGLITILGHLPMFIKYFPPAKLSRHWCLTIFVEVIYDLSLSVNFFVYFYFNKTFQKCFKRIIMKSN